MVSPALPTPFVMSPMCNLKYKFTSRSSAKRYIRQGGFSLIELLVGITIGLLVVLAAIGSLVFTQLTTTVLGDSARLQQTADSVFRNIGFHVMQAGAMNIESDTGNPSVIRFSNVYTGFNPATTSAATGQIFSVHGINGAATGSDTLRVSYQDNMLTSDTAADKTAFGVRDCLGNRPASSIRVDNQFSVTGTDLMCLGAANSTAAQSIANGVEDFQVTYGVLTLNGGADQVRYYTANNVVDWTQIQAVTICLQLTGENRGNPQPGLTTTGCRGQTVANDGLLRRVFWRTFAIRNALL